MEHNEQEQSEFGIKNIVQAAQSFFLLTVLSAKKFMQLQSRKRYACSGRTIWKHTQEI